MKRVTAAAFLLCLLGGVLSPAPQELIPAGITCCDEQKIRQAMTEEALARIASLAEPRGQAADYLSEQAFAKIGKHLPAGGLEQRLAYMREALKRPAPDADTREFQVLVGNFILGMTLEIGDTFQDEYDRARADKEKVNTLLDELQKTPAASGEVPAQVLFKAGISRKELRRIRALGRKWRDVPDDASSFAEFNFLKKNISGVAADPDQGLVFTLAEAYRPRFPFLDEFMENYRRLAKEFREAARQLNILLAVSGE
jgi:hypothetical protein